MLYYNRTDVSEGIDFNNNNYFQEYKICNYNSYFKISFCFQTCLCDAMIVISYCKKL